MISEPPPSTTERPPTGVSLKIKILIGLLVCSYLPSLVLIALSSTNNSFSHNLISLILVGLATPIPLLLFLTLRINHSVNNLSKLSQVLDLLKKGETGPRIEVNNKDEIGLIASQINDLTQSYKATVANLQSDKELVSSDKNKLNAIIYSITDGIIVLDLSFRILIVNKALEEMMGFSGSELVGQPIENVIKIEIQNNVASLSQTIKNLMVEADPKTIYRAEAKVSGRAGLSATVKLTIVGVSDSVQADLGAILILHNITQERLFEQMQIDFVSMASHEFRTPLTSVINYLSILQSEAGNKLTSEHKQFLDRAISSASQLSELVNNMLNVSKIERASLTIAPSIIDWAEQIQKAVDNNHSQAIQKNINLKINLSEPNLPKVMADPLRIQEVLNNLIGNALKYSPGGSGVVEIGSKVQGDDILTYVKDYGPGISAIALPHIFEKFFRAPGSLEMMNQGAGLGLFITKSILELHQGKIWVESTEGKGATFYFTLPIAHEDSLGPSIVKLDEAKLT